MILRVASGIRKRVLDLSEEICGRAYNALLLSFLMILLIGLALSAFEA